MIKIETLIVHVNLVTMNPMRYPAPNVQSNVTVAVVLPNVMNVI